MADETILQICDCQAYQDIEDARRRAKEDRHVDDQCVPEAENDR